MHVNLASDEVLKLIKGTLQQLKVARQSFTSVQHVELDIPGGSVTFTITCRQCNFFTHFPRQKNLTSCCCCCVVTGLDWTAQQQTDARIRVNRRSSQVILCSLANIQYEVCVCVCVFVCVWEGVCGWVGCSGRDRVFGQFRDGSRKMRLKWMRHPLLRFKFDQENFCESFS